MVLTSIRNADSRPPDEEKYPALRIVLMIWKALVIIQVLAVVIFGAYAFFGAHAGKATNQPNPLALGLLVIVVGLVWAIFQWASIELVEVFMDIEENTRCMAERT